MFQIKKKKSNQLNLSLDPNEISDNWTMVLGEKLETMNEEQWNNLLKFKYIVFARYLFLFCYLTN